MRHDITPQCEPAASIIRRLGGTTAVAAATKIHRQGVWKWTKPKRLGGTGGIIPIPHIRTLIRFGDSIGVPLCAEDFLPIEDAPGREA